MKKYLASILFYIVLLFLSANAKAAVIHDIYVQPSSPIWMGQNENSVDVSMYVECEFNGTNNPTGVLSYPDNTQASINFQPVTNATNKYVYSIPLSAYGAYNLQVTCGENESKASGEISFTIKKLFLEVTSPSDNQVIQTYPMDVFDISAKVRVNDVYVDASHNPRFEAYLIDSNNNAWKLSINEPPRYDTNTKVWYIKPKVNIYDIPPGLYDLKLKVYVTLDGAERTAEYTVYSSVMVSDALKINLIYPNQNQPVTLSEASKINITLQVLERGVPVDNLATSNFEVVVEGNGQRKSLPITGMSYDRNSQRYMLEVYVPELRAAKDNYDLWVKVSYDSYAPATSPKVPLWFVLKFAGKLVDPSGNIINAQIRLTDYKRDIEIRTDGLGRYAVALPGGKYDMDIRLPEIRRLDIFGVNIESDAIDKIRYDYFTGNPGIDGLKAIKLVVIEFGLPFEAAYLEIPYNDALVQNENNMKVYRCTVWNFGRRECVGEWKEVDAKVDIVANIISMNVSALGAFVIGGRDVLVASIKDIPKSYYAGDEIAVEGVVRDSNGDVVAGAKVKYAIKGTKISGEVNTTIGGKFSFVANAPTEEGDYELSITVEKPPYVSYTTSYIIHVEKKVDMSLVAPDVVDVYFDKDKVVNVKIENTGQVELKNIKIQLSGLKYEWYALVPSYISQINPGESKNVEVHVNIPSEDCKVEKCDKYYFAKLSVTSDELSDSAGFTVKLRDVEEYAAVQAAGNQTQTAEKSILPNIDMSGMLTFKGANTTNTYLVIAFTIAGFIIITIKKRKRKAGMYRSRILLPRRMM